MKGEELHRLWDEYQKAMNKGQSHLDASVQSEPLAVQTEPPLVVKVEDFPELAAMEEQWKQEIPLVTVVKQQAPLQWDSWRLGSHRDDYFPIKRRKY
jgi:hypothetical protein